MRKLNKEQKDKLFVINLERILADKNMSKKELAEKLNCTPQTISNYSKRGVPEAVAIEIAEVLGVSEKELYRTEAENEFYALKKINIERAILATWKGKLCVALGFAFLCYIMYFYGDVINLFATLIMLLFFEVVGAIGNEKLIDKIFRVGMRITELLAIVVIMIQPFIEV